MNQWRIALRSLRRRPAFALTVFVLLAVGIAVNTAVFSVVYTVLLKPLPYPEPSRLVALYESSSAASQKQSLIAPGRLEDWNRLNRSFQAIAGSYTENVTDNSGAEPERLSGLRVSPRYFTVFGAQPIVGRTFTADEEREGGPLAAVISEGLWTRRYGRSSGVAAQRLLVGGKAYAIVGVMGATFARPSIDLWVPAQTPAWLTRMRNARFLGGVGRMKPGVTIEQARADLARLQRALADEFPNTDKGWSASVQALEEVRVGTAGQPLILLFASVVLLFLVAITNIAGLVVAQLVQRQRELAIRTSLGATRGQVLATVMRELLPLSAAGGLAGFGLALAATSLLVRLFADVPRMPELGVDWRALAFAIATSLGAVLVFGLLPAESVTRGHNAAVGGGRAVVGGRQRLQRVLVAGQIAFTMLLLVTSGLLLRSFVNLRQADTGFDARHTVTFHVGAAWNEDRTRIGRVQERLIDELGRLPGAEAAGITNFLPASGATLRYQVSLEGETSTDETARMPVGYRMVSAGYLKALRVPLLAGAWCPELSNDAAAPRRVMVNRRFVEVYGRGHYIVGRHLDWKELGYGAAQARDEISGVVGDIREDALSQPPYPYVYSCAIGGGWPDPDYVVRTAGDPAALLRSVRELVRRVDPTRAVFGAQPLEDYFDSVLDRPRSNARMIGLFSGAALLIAAVGLYGLVAHMVSVRRREIGVRMALGARRSQVVSAVIGHAGRLIGCGIAGGCVLVLAVSSALRSVVFGVSPLDVASIGGAAAVLAVVSLAAALLAGRAAAWVDPMESIRAE